MAIKLPNSTFILLFCCTLFSKGKKVVSEIHKKLSLDRRINLLHFLFYNESQNPNERFEY